ncbi:hypothetical protein TNCV_2053261 [Trichonephila clavipes]|nr:hypothetical protein TNCV_2053261 [Trichonephila clavipes]
MTPDLAPPSPPNYHTTPIGGRFSSRQPQFYIYAGYDGSGCTVVMVSNSWLERGRSQIFTNVCRSIARFGSCAIKSHIHSLTHLSSPSTHLTRGLVARRLFKVPPCREGTINLKTSMSSRDSNPDPTA